MAYQDDFTGFNLSDANRFINSQGNFLDQVPEAEGAFLTKAPGELWNAFGQISQNGIYGKGGVQNILGQLSNASAIRRKQLGRGLRASAGRRLGPRSGAIDTLVANKIQAPELAGLTETGANLTAQNQQSKMQGLQNALAVIQLMQQRYGDKWWEAAKGDGSGGLLGIVKAITSIGSGVAGIPGLGNLIGLGGGSDQKVMV